MSHPIEDMVCGGNSPVHFDEDGYCFGTGASTSGVFDLGETLTGIRLVLRANAVSTLGTGFSATVYGGDDKDATVGGTAWTALKTFASTGGTYGVNDVIDEYYPPTGTSKKYYYVAVAAGPTGGEVGVWNELIPGR